MNRGCRGGGVLWFCLCWRGGCSPPYRQRCCCPEPCILTRLLLWWATGWWCHWRIWWLWSYPGWIFAKLSQLFTVCSHRFFFFSFFWKRTIWTSSVSISFMFHLCCQMFVLLGPMQLFTQTFFFLLIPDHNSFFHWFTYHIIYWNMFFFYSIRHEFWCAPVLNCWLVHVVPCLCPLTISIRCSRPLQPQVHK